ncbi:MAG: TonB-dependent receptor domain-containing protein [Acidobacteriota bacterium]|jgi:hypothetical protein
MKLCSRLLRGSGVAFLVFLLAFQAPLSHAQVLYGALVGAVKDASGAAVPGAKVVITNQQTGQVRETVTNEEGGYNFPTIQNGVYEVRITKDGFKSVTNSATVAINETVRVDLTLQVGAVSDTVTVEASSATLQTDRAEVRAEVTSKQLTNLPVPVGRNYQNLLVTVPGFSPPRNAHSVPSNPSRSLEANVNGATRSSVNTRIDGVSSTNIWLPHISAYVPSLEAIETVNVVTNSFSAEQGLAGGASISVQIKSGTNDLHGSAFLYNTNNKVIAKPFFLPQGQRNPKYIFNQFGATVGGPIKKNKLFYFAAYEGTTRREFANSFGTMPTTAMRTGDLSATDRPIFDPLTGDDQGRGRTPFAGNILPANRISPIARTLTGKLPTPNVPSAFIQQNYFAVGNFLFDRQTLDTKMNYNISDKWTMYGRFSVLDYTMENAGMLGELIGPGISGAGGNVGVGVGQTYSTTIASTYVLKPSFIIDSYFGFTQMNTKVEQPGLEKNLGRDLLGIPGTNGTRTFEGGWPRFSVSNFTTFGVPDAFMPYNRRDPQFQYVANANWTKGTHNIRFGIDYYKMNMNHLQPEFSGANHGAVGGFSFTGGPTQLNGGASANEFNSWGAFLLGAPNNYGRLLQVDDVYKTRTNMFSSYVQDTWNVNRKLTLNYGVRYEYFPMPTRGDRGVERYDFANNKMFVCGVGVMPRDCGIRQQKLQFSPRLGIAYRPTDKTVIRTGFGINWDPWNLARTHRTNFPMLVILNGNAPNAFVPVSRLEQGIPNIPNPELGNGIIDVPTNYAVVSAGDEFKRSYIMSWNFTIQRQVGKGFVAQAGYVANRQVKQTGNLDLNAGQIPGAGVNGAPYFQRFGRRVTTQLLTPIGHTSYNALQTTLEKRFAKGYSLNVAYTWSKAMGICCNSNSDGGPAIQALPFYNLNRSLADFDRTHNFQVTSLWELPFGKGKAFANDGVAAAILGGWQLNGLLSLYSGSPFNVTADGASLNLFSGSTQRADYARPGKVTKIGKVGQGQPFFDFTAFKPVTDARFGDASFMALRGPRIGNADVGIFRQFKFGERVSAQLRIEMLNLTNTPQFGNPSGNISNLRLNPDNSFRSGVFEVTGLANTGRDGLTQRAFRFGLRMGF